MSAQAILAAMDADFGDMVKRSGRDGSNRTSLPEILNDPAKRLPTTEPRNCDSTTMAINGRLEAGCASAYCQTASASATIRA